MGGTEPVIVDTDPGIDDSLALLLAARWPWCRLVGVSVCYGNTTLELATRNARLVLRRAASDVPVLQGADRPLHRPLVTAKETHGPEGLGDHTADEPDPVSPSSSALRDLLRLAGEPVTLVTLGPLTNLANAIRVEQELVRSRVRRHVAMAGCLDARGTQGPHAEFNLWCDPEAADEVLRAGLPTELVGLDVTRRLVIPAAAVAKLATHADPDARWLGRLLGFYVRFHEEEESLSGAVMNDPLAVALALESSWGTCERLPLRVDLSSGPDRGRLAVGNSDSGDPTVSFFRDFDLQRVRSLLLEHVFEPWLTLADLTI